MASDECYAEFTWAGAPRSILEHGSAGVLAVHSCSKRSNLAGMRAGFYAGDEELVGYLKLVRQHAGFMVPAPVQAAVAVAFDDDEHVNVQRERYRDRLTQMSGALQDFGVEAPMPEGAFYLWCSKEGLDGWQLASEIAERGARDQPGRTLRRGWARFRAARGRPERRTTRAGRLETSRRLNLASTMAT